MSAKQASKRKGIIGAPKKKVTKVRTNISIDPAVLKRGQRMAFEDGRSFSTWLEQMVRAKLEVAP